MIPKGKDDGEGASFLRGLHSPPDERLMPDVNTIIRPEGQMG
jgi:hypothetical protein